MNQPVYNNIPQEGSQSSSDPTLQVFDEYYNSPIDINNNELIAMRGFFEKRGFAEDSAETISIIILKQARKDGYNALQIMDTLSGFSSVEISSLVGEILNYNRLNTSVLGVTQFLSPSEEVTRNILA